MIFRSPRILWSLLAVSLALLSGCSFKQNAPVHFNYVIEAPRSGAALSEMQNATLRLRSFTVAPSYEQRGFVYRTSELGYESDFYQQFLVNPRSMLTEQARQWLNASGLFSAIIDPASQVDSTFILEGHISALYADMRNKSSPKTVLSIEFALLDHRNGRPVIAFRHGYRQEIPADNRSAAALAQSWSKGLAQILGALESDLAKVELSSNR